MSKEFKHYHMCQSCGEKFGGKLTASGITVVHGVCKYCENPIEQYLIPWIDFDWPAEDAYASDFLDAMERLKLIIFDDELNKE